MLYNRVTRTPKSIYERTLPRLYGDVIAPMLLPVKELERTPATSHDVSDGRTRTGLKMVSVLIPNLEAHFGVRSDVG